MAFEHGSGADFSLDDSTGTPRNISAYIIDVSGIGEEAATHDVTTLSKSSVVRLAGLKDMTFTLQCIFDATLDGYMGPAVGKTCSYFYGPQGSTGGNVKYSGEAILRKYDIKGPVGAPIGVTLTLERTGDGTRGTY